MKGAAALIRLTFLEIARKKDFYVALALTGVILVFVSRMNFYNVGNVSRYLREFGLALIFLFSAVLTVPLAARQYPSETRDRTLAVLLAKPVSRGEFVLGKFLGAALSGIACFLVFYGIFLLFTLKAPPDPATAVQTAVLYAAGLAALAAMASCLSYYMTFPANVTLSLCAFLLMIGYGADLRGFFESWPGPFRAAGTAVYLMLPHFEFFDLRQRFIHEWGPVSFRLAGAVVAYSAALCAAFLTAGWLKFRRVPA